MGQTWANPGGEKTSGRGTYASLGHFPRRVTALPARGTVAPPDLYTAYVGRYEGSECGFHASSTDFPIPIPN